MNVTLPLDKMTTEEKLYLMDVIWQDLIAKEEEIESPEWHGEVLRERMQAVEEGKVQFIDWETAKKQILDRCK